MENISAIYM